MLAAAGIPAALLQNAQARVSAVQFAAVWLRVCDELQDEFLGLDSEAMRPGSFALICRSMPLSRTLGQGLSRALKGFDLFLSELKGHLTADDRSAHLTLEVHQPDASRRAFAHEILATVLHGMVCWMAGQHVPITLAAFSYPRPAHGDEYHGMFGPEVQFDAPATVLTFEAHWLARPLTLNEAAVRSFLAKAPLSLFVKYRDPHSWAARTRKTLRAIPPAAWPLHDEISLQLGVTGSTFTRRLAREGTSYQQIKDGLRRDRAIRLLSDTPQGIADIAAAVGFEEVSAFHRAFRRWTGTSPGRYRLPE